MRRTLSGTCYAVDSGDFVPSNSTMDADDICNLLGSLSLKGGLPVEVQDPLSQNPTFKPSRDDARLCQVDVGCSSGNSGDTDMMEVRDAQGNVQFIPTEERPGCGIIHSLQAQFNYPPTAPVPTQPVNFLESILTHREAFVAFPYGHRSCSSALTALAFHLEHRSRENNSDGDLDTAIALHNEAWLMAGWR